MKFRVLLFLFSFFFVIQAQSASQPTVAEAQQFMEQAQARLNEIGVKAAGPVGCRKTSSLTTPKRWQPMPRINSPRSPPN